MLMALIRIKPGSLRTTHAPRELRPGMRLAALFLGLAALCFTADLPAQPGPPPDNGGPSLSRPRNLNLRLLPRGRVRLTWLSPRRLNYQ